MVCNSVKALAKNHKEWANDYEYNIKTNEFVHKSDKYTEKEMVKGWFKF